MICGETSNETSLFTLPVPPKSPTSLIFALVSLVFVPWGSAVTLNVDPYGIEGFPSFPFGACPSLYLNGTAAFLVVQLCGSPVAVTVFGVNASPGA